ncbi:hypothetical protein D9758_012680 [Tetrapyrgos nigripes]|uniref:AB hydrolase-1 domain-containing protein n=1 Tax=Tetrapyrgos nigripes TaxID=182062 RepID=A0A8H5CW20_9AGAR|nr:hypothetical protein D9758_012680 [Tetrapyrgos nigripes]
MPPPSITSRLVPGRYPPPNTNPIADRIRARRGARGLTPLDGTLLHVPPVAEGWNTLLGSVRTKGKVPGDVREIMILRVAARNGAAFEWIHHEHVGRDEGLGTEQLWVVRDFEGLPALRAVGNGDNAYNSVLSPLQSAALAFADYSTSQVQVPPKVTAALKKALRNFVLSSSSSSQSQDKLDIESQIQDLLVECAAITASYNMVSRFLISLDIATKSDERVPWPASVYEFRVGIPSVYGREGENDQHQGHFLHVETHITNPDPSTPWIVCCNSLLTNTSMWQWALPYILGPQPLAGKEGTRKLLGKYTTYNVLLHDQRGHGQSSYPGQVVDGTSTPLPDLPCTIPILAADVAHILRTLHTCAPIKSNLGKIHGKPEELENPIKSPIESTLKTIIGVSQGGAVALSFASQFPELLKQGRGGIVSCDTGPKTPLGNKEAWDERLQLAKSDGLEKLADVTVPRWFARGSRCSPEDASEDLEKEENVEKALHSRTPRTQVISEMITSTPLEGFRIGAGALSGYDLITPTQTPTNTSTGQSLSLLDSDIPTLLIAGELDGGGKVAKGMGDLERRWNERRKERGTGDVLVRLEVIKGAGHLPMVDETEEWWGVVGGWVNGL